MKELIIRYKDSRVLSLLRSLSKYFDFTVSEARETDPSQKSQSFTVLHVDPMDYKFDREEANER